MTEFLPKIPNHHLQRKRFFFTSVNLNYIDKAITLWESLKEFEPTAEFVTVIVEPLYTKTELNQKLVEINFPDTLSSTLLIHDIPWNWIDKSKGLSVVEACTAVKASAAKYLLGQSLHSQVTYLDPDMQVFGGLDEVDQLLDKYSFILTPHLLESPSIEDSVVSNEIAGAMVHGIYNLGFFAVKSSREGYEVLTWWETRLSKYCKANPGSGIFTDQKWFDAAVVYFPEIGVLNHPGYNVAPWNLGERFLRHQDGNIFVNGLPLKIFHFSSYDSTVHIEMLKKFDLSNISLELNMNYSKALEKNCKYLVRSNTKEKNENTFPRIVTMRKLKNISIFYLRKLISFSTKNKIVIYIYRHFSVKIRKFIVDLMTKFINKNLERPHKNQNYDYKNLRAPEWIIVTHAGGGGADQIFRTIAKFMNLSHKNQSVVIKAEPEWIQIQTLGGSNLYGASNNEFKEIIQFWIESGSKIIINHIQGHEWWLLETSWAKTRPIVLVHDRAFLRKSIFDPIVGKDLLFDTRLYSKYSRHKEESWILNWQDLINSSEIVLTPSHWIKEEMIDAFPQGKVKYFPWFDSFNMCYLPPAKVNTEPTVVGVIGATNEHKGIYDLAKAASIAAQNETNIKFILFGDVPKTFQHLLEFDNIGIAGQIRRSRLINSFKHHGVSIIWFCSNVEESFSLALSDALYSGMPILAKKGGAYSERISTRGKSWLYDPQLDFNHLNSFFSSPDSYESAKIQSNPLIAQSADIDDETRQFILKYDLDKMRWLSILGF